MVGESTDDHDTVKHVIQNNARSIGRYEFAFRLAAIPAIVGFTALMTNSVLNTQPDKDMQQLGVAAALAAGGTIASLYSSYKRRELREEMSLEAREHSMDFLHALLCEEVEDIPEYILEDLRSLTQ